MIGPLQIHMNKAWTDLTKLMALLFAISLVSASHASESRVTVEKIHADLSANGARYVIDHYFGCEPPIGEGYNLVESGTRSGVRLGIEMLKYSDACVTENLQSSLGTAMTRAPIIVLPYVNTNQLLSADQICLPFISADDPRDRQKIIIAQARRSLLRVHVKSLERQRAACLAEAR